MIFDLERLDYAAFWFILTLPMSRLKVNALGQSSRSQGEKLLKWFV